MTTTEMNQLMENIQNQIAETRKSGQKEYAHDEDNVFANFERVANTLDITRETALMTYLLKHIDGVVSYTKGHKSQREDVRGRLTDIIVYTMLLWGMVEDEDN
ncbi:MAG: hypothetical protein H8E74_02045 [Gammaproteobacteria bacterium]|nr:hypothetical protein [Gammaproteobacteria bacterium]